MEIHIEKIKTNRKQMSIAHIITISLSLIKSSVTIVYIGKEFESLGMNSNLPTDCDYI